MAARSSNRRSFSVERKTFSVQFAKDVVEVGERSKNVQISVGIEVHLVKWLIEMIRRLLNREKKVRFIGSRKGTTMDVSLNLKRNKGGFFLSLLCFSATSTKGFKCLCFPIGAKAIGWKLLLTSLEWVLNIKPGVEMVEIARRQLPEKVMAPVVSHETVAELRNELVVLVAEEQVDSWDKVSLELQKLLSFEACPRSILPSKKKALLDVKSVEERDQILNLKSFSYNGVKIYFSNWTPGVDTLASSWFKPGPRWVTFVGIPFHLLTVETMDHICQGFGKIKGYSRGGTDFGGLSGAKVLVERCDVRLVPQFIPLVDLGGVVYPVRLFLDVEDNGGAEESYRDFQGVSPYVSVEKGRSYAEVVASDGRAARFNSVWRCRGSTQSVSALPSKRLSTDSNVEASFPRNVLSSPGNTVVIESQMDSQNSCAEVSQVGSMGVNKGQKETVTNEIMVRTEQQSVCGRLLTKGLDVDLNQHATPASVSSGGDNTSRSPSSLLAINPDIEEAQIGALQDQDMDLNGEGSVDLNLVESESEGETVEENFVVEGDSIFQEQEVDDEWYTEEEAPLGQLFDEVNRLLL